MAIYNGHNEDQNGNILLCIGNGMTAALETGTTASQAYTVGSYLFFNNRLCKASAAISSGDTLSIGTNLLETTVGAELSSHLRASDGTEFYFDYKNNKYGYNTSPSRSIDTFFPFASDRDFRLVVRVRVKNRQTPHQGTEVNAEAWRNFTITRTNGSFNFNWGSSSTEISSTYGMVGQTGDQSERGCNGYSYITSVQLVSFTWL